MTIDRRSLLRSGVAASAALLGARAVQAQPHAGHGSPQPQSPPQPPPATPAPARATPGALGYTPVIVPNGATLPFERRGGVKVFHLIAEAFAHEIAPGLTITAWGYNGRTPGPLIEAVEGDRVRIYVTNKLPEPTTVHWHGVIVPSGMDGVAGLTQKAIQPGETFKYEFTFAHPGTFMYHPHYDEMTQIALGMVGMIVVHPRRPESRPARDYALMAHEWKIPIGAARPDPMAMSDFNVLTFNSKAYPATEPAGRGARRAGADPLRQPGPDGSPPDPPARPRLRDRRDRWRPRATLGALPRDHRAGAGRRGARDRVHRERR